MKINLNIFEKITSIEEKEFLEKTVEDTTSGLNDLRTGTAYSILTNFYLAKQIELASKSNDKSSQRMFWLTIAIAFLGACQIVVAIIGLFVSNK